MTDYFSRLDKSPLIRIQYPRTKANVGLYDRETCKVDFPLRLFKYKLLRKGAQEGKYVFFYEYADPQKKTEFLITKFLDTFVLYYFLSKEESRMLKQEVMSGKPYLGTVMLDLEESGNHIVSFLLRKGSTRQSYELFLFETYDTSAVFFNNSNAWIDPLVSTLSRDLDGAKISYTRTIPPTFNLQEYDEDNKGRCVMWGLVFLYKLSLLPNLSTATRDDFNSMYNELNTLNTSKSTYSKIESIVYGASRKKTRRVKRKHRIGKKTARGQMDTKTRILR